MPDQKNQEVKHDAKNESNKLTQEQDELKQREEKKRKIELAQEMEKKREKDKKEEELDRIKQEQAAESKRRYCGLCGKEFFPVRICRCAAVGGGGGSGGGEGTEEQSTNEGKTPTNFVNKLFEMAGQFGTAIMHAIDGTSSKEKDHRSVRVMFNTDVISDLLSKKLLLIDNNLDSGILTIKLLCVPSILSVEQKKELNKFIEAILEQLDEYKKEKGIMRDCMKRDKDGGLYISLPNPKMYDEFIKVLAQKNLLPKQVLEQKENKQAVFQEGINHFNPMSLSTKLTYGSHKNVKDEELKKIENKNLTIKDERSSSIRPRSPSDGPKPK